MEFYNDNACKQSEVNLYCWVRRALHKAGGKVIPGGFFELMYIYREVKCIGRISHTLPVDISRSRIWAGKKKEDVASFLPVYIVYIFCS